MFRLIEVELEKWKGGIGPRSVSIFVVIPAGELPYNAYTDF